MAEGGGARTGTPTDHSPAHGVAVDDVTLDAPAAPVGQFQVGAILPMMHAAEGMNGVLGCCQANLRDRVHLGWSKESAPHEPVGAGRWKQHRLWLLYGRSTLPMGVPCTERRPAGRRRPAASVPSVEDSRRSDYAAADSPLTCTKHCGVNAKDWKVAGWMAGWQDALASALATGAHPGLSPPDSHLKSAVASNEEEGAIGVPAKRPERRRRKGITSKSSHECIVIERRTVRSTRLP
jgi:hypothetical protein